MRIKLFFIAGIMGVAVMSGIMKGLSSHRRSSEKEEAEKTGAGEARLCEKAAT
jgi:hypothetical protein